MAIRQTRKVSWGDVRDQVISVNPELGRLIDGVSPLQKDYLYVCEYAFGDVLLEQGVFSYPAEEGLLTLGDPNTPQSFVDDLSYAGGDMPTGIMLKSGMELIIQHKQKINTVWPNRPGDVVSLWSRLEEKNFYLPSSMFSATAGARSLFLLPTVGDAYYHKHIKKRFNIHLEPPKHLLDEWHVFKALVHAEQYPWKMSVLFFTEQWMHCILKDPAWHEVYLWLLEYSWKNSAYRRNKAFYDYALSCAQVDRNLKPNPYIMDTVRHVLSIVLGSMPGFQPATDEVMAPIGFLQTVYNQVYGLTKYLPTFMEPTMFNVTEAHAKPVYYSLQLPMMLTFSPRSRKQASTLYDLRELEYLMRIFLDEIREQECLLENTVFQMLPDLTQISYYHTQDDEHGDILQTSLMPEQDPRFLEMLAPTVETQKFASFSAFVKGCIKMERQS